MTEKLERPCSSSAQTSPSRTQSDVRTARSSARATVAKRSVRSLPRRLTRVASPAGQPRDRPVAVPLDLEQPAVAPGNVVGERRQHRLVLAALPPRRRLVVLLAQEEPVLLVPVEMRRDERPRSPEPLALEPDRQAAVGLLLEQLVRPAVPDLDRPGAVLARRDLALEARVVERVVLDVHGEPAVTRVERDALGDGPARQGAVTLETEVVVEPPCVMALDDEEGPLTPLRAARRRARASCPSLRFRSYSRSRLHAVATDASSGQRGDNPVDAVDCSELSTSTRGRRPSPGTCAGAGDRRSPGSSGSSSASAAWTDSASRRGGLVVVRVRASGRLRHDPVDDAELEAVDRVGLECGRGLLRLARVAPQDRRAPLRGDDRVDRRSPASEPGRPPRSPRRRPSRPRR